MSDHPTIPGYQTKRLIGRGGMGMVYLAEQLSLGREIALKIMQKSLAENDPKFVERFAREAKITASLRHPNVITVYDSGQHDGALYMAMEFVPGGALDRKIRRGKVDHDEVIRITDGIAAGLECAHGAGLVHRDIKPANILIESDGTPVLTDFGIVKINESETELTGTSVVGSPSYMSPEQLLGEAVDGRADLYSLGIVLFEMLEGHKPFASDQAYAVGLMHLNDAPPPLSEGNRRFASLVERLLEKDPNDRIRTAAAVRNALVELPSTGNASNPSARPSTPSPRKRVVTPTPTPTPRTGLEDSQPTIARRRDGEWNSVAAQPPTPVSGGRARVHKSQFRDERVPFVSEQRTQVRKASIFSSFWLRAVAVAALLVVASGFIVPGFRFSAVGLEMQAAFGTPADRHRIAERMESQGMMDRARFWFEKAGEGGQTGSFYRLGTSWRYEDEAKAIAALDRELSDGRRATWDAPAAIMLGGLLCNQRGVENCGRAARTLQNAIASTDDRRAMLMLAQLLHERIDPPDFASARRWYQSALDESQGNARTSLEEEALLGLAQLYEGGLGVAQDARLAAVLTARAANNPTARGSTRDLAKRRCAALSASPNECRSLR